MSKSPVPPDGALDLQPLATEQSDPQQQSDAREPAAQAPTRDSGQQVPVSNPDLAGEPLPHKQWQRYQIVSFLGAGGMGAVYKARDPRLHRSVAIKFLRDSGGPDTRQRRSFEREARAQARIEHPHICKIYEVGEVDGQPYIAMQLIAGTSFAGAQQTMGLVDKVRVLQKVAEALHAAHTHDLIHRDIKPAEVPADFFRRPSAYFARPWIGCGQIRAGLFTRPDGA